MSSLPPYNPSSSERRLWLLNVATDEPDRERLLDSLPGVQRIASENPSDLRKRVESAAGDIAVTATEAVLEALVLSLVRGRPGSGRLRFLPGTLSQVQMLADRAVVRHLSPGVEL